MKTNRNSIVAIAMATALMSLSVHAQHHTNGQAGTFGITQSDSDSWVFGVPHTFNVNNQYSIRFTAQENVTVDRVFQRITGLTGGNLTVELRNDDGSGLPGSLITSATVSPSADIQSVMFGSAAPLTSGNIYHVQYKTTTGGGLFRVGGADTVVRPYDRAVDTNVTLLRSDNSGASWSDQTAEPYFWFANGSDTTVVAGPGQPYSGFSTPSNQNTVQGGGGGKAGQRFTITDKEIPAGKWVAFNKFRFTPLDGGTASINNQNLVARFRDINSVILASTTITPSQANGTEQEFTLDQQIELQQGVPYVLTFELDLPGQNSDFYFLRQQNSYGFDGSEIAAGWGGKTISYPVRLPFGNIWLPTDFAPQNDGFNDRADIVFSFQGIVVPEPSAIGFLLFGGALLFWRRKR